MMYLKFVGNESQPIVERVFAVKDYSVSKDDVGTRIYVAPGMWERLSPKEWLNCFVVSESGKTISAYHVG